MKTWFERLTEADARANVPWYRRLGQKERHWPFTDDDMMTVMRVSHRTQPSYLDLCMTGEVIARYGLTESDKEIWNLGNAFFKAVLYSDLAAAWRLHDAIEDRALQLKREAQP